MVDVPGGLLSILAPLLPSHHLFKLYVGFSGICSQTHSWLLCVCVCVCLAKLWSNKFLFLESVMKWIFLPWGYPSQDAQSTGSQTDQMPSHLLTRTDSTLPVTFSEPHSRANKYLCLEIYEWNISCHQGPYNLVEEVIISIYELQGQIWAIITETTFSGSNPATRILRKQTSLIFKYV